jgi:hypothetical protein
MKKIKLTQGKVATIDNIDFDLTQNKWQYHRGYAIRHNSKDHRLIDRMHRIILIRKLGHARFKYADHINGNKLDNRRDNLRPATVFQNQHNRKKQTNVSGYKGVIWNKKLRRWQVMIQVKNKRIHLGLFDKKLDAAKAYNDAAKKYHKEFAKLNIL